MGKIKVFKNNADPQKKADATAAFLSRLPRDPDFVGTDEDWIEKKVFEFFQDQVKAGKKKMAAEAVVVDVADVV